MLLNNGCESFNNAIRVARHMPILSMLEWMMSYVMTRHQKNRDLARSSWRNEKLCPKITKIIQKHMENFRQCFPRKSNDRFYQVKEPAGGQYTVDLLESTCGCRQWDVSGIPCVHALRAIGAQDYSVEDFVHRCYKVDTYKDVYSTAVMPINGRKLWKKSPLPPPLPPKCASSVITVGRPALHHRRPEEGETVDKRKNKCKGKPPGPSAKNPKVMKRNQRTCRCNFCGEKGHNSKTCKKKKESVSSCMILLLIPHNILVTR